MVYSAGTGSCTAGRCYNDRSTDSKIRHSGVILVGPLTVKPTALSLPIFTTVAPVNQSPLLYDISWQTVVGEKETMVGVCAPAERKVPPIKNAVLHKIRAADLVQSHIRT